MTFTSSTSNLIPGVMSLSLLGNSVSMLPKEIGIPKKRYRKKGRQNSSSKMIKGFTNIMVGIPMIKATSNLTSGL